MIRRGFGCAALAALGLLTNGCAGVVGMFGAPPTDPMAAELARLEAAQERQAAEAARFAEAERAKPPQTVEERLRRGDTHLAAGELADALWEYASAHRLDPQHPAPRVRLGYVHLRSEPERARPLFESALELDPEEVSAHIGLGLALVRAGETEAGLGHLSRAVEIAPGSPKARAAYGVSLDRVGRHDEAVAQLEHARDLRPEDARILNNLGVSYLRAGRPADAEPVLRKALRIDRRDAELRSNNLGLALALQGKFDDALEAFRRGGDEQGAHSNLGYVHYLRGEYGQAIQHFERALVVGGDADLQVVRNLEAARYGQRTDFARKRRDDVPITGDPVAPAGDVDAATLVESEADLALEPAPEPDAARSDDPWLRPPPSPPGSLPN